MLKEFLLGLFRGVKLKGELQQVRAAARQDAALVVGTYVDEFQTAARELLAGRQQRFIGTDSNVIEGECVPAKRRKR